MGSVGTGEGSIPVGRVGCALSPGQSPEWTFVVGRSFLAAVPIGTPNEIVATLIALVAEPQVKVESVVSLLPLSGEQTVESFVVVVQGEATDEDGIPVSAVVRGAIAADVFSVGGSRRFTAQGIRPWLLADFQAVIGIVIGSPLSGVVRPNLLDSGVQVGIGAVSGNTLFWSGAGSGTVTGQNESVGDTVIRAPNPIETSGADGVPDADTILRPSQVLEGTALLWRRDSRHVQTPTASSVHYGFRLPNGVERRLDVVYFLGRRPRSPRITVARPRRLIAVTSPTSAVSGTHLEIRQEGDSVVVTDLGSTNGTIVIPPRGRKQRLVSGQALVVMPGTTVDIGDGNIIEILPASSQ